MEKDEDERRVSAAATARSDGREGVVVRDDDSGLRRRRIGSQRSEEEEEVEGDASPTSSTASKSEKTLNVSPLATTIIRRLAPHSVAFTLISDGKSVLSDKRIKTFFWYFFIVFAMEARLATLGVSDEETRAEWPKSARRRYGKDVFVQNPLEFFLKNLIAKFFVLQILVDFVFLAFGIRYKKISKEGENDEGEEENARVVDLAFEERVYFVRHVIKTFLRIPFVTFWITGVDSSVTHVFTTKQFLLIAFMPIVVGKYWISRYSSLSISFAYSLVISAFAYIYQYCACGIRGCWINMPHIAWTFRAFVFSFPLLMHIVYKISSMKKRERDVSSSSSSPGDVKKRTSSLTNEVTTPIKEERKKEEGEEDTLIVEKDEEDLVSNERSSLNSQSVSTSTSNDSSVSPSSQLNTSSSSKRRVLQRERNISINRSIRSDLSSRQSPNASTNSGSFQKERKEYQRQSSISEVEERESGEEITSKSAKQQLDQTQNVKLPLITDMERQYLEKAFEKNASIAHVGFFSLAMEALISGIERKTYEENQVIAKPKDIEESFVILVKGTAMSYEDDDNAPIDIDQEGKVISSTKEKNTTVLKEGSTWAEGAIVEPHVNTRFLVANNINGAEVIKIHKSHFERAIKTVRKISESVALRIFLSCKRTSEAFENDTERMKYASKYALKKYKRAFRKGEEICGILEGMFKSSENESLLHFLIDGTVILVNTKDPSATRTVEAGSWFETSFDERGEKNEICSSSSALSVIISFNAGRLDACNDAYIRRVEKDRMKHDSSTSRSKERKRREEEQSHSPSPRRFSIDTSWMRSRRSSLSNDESGTATPTESEFSDDVSDTDSHENDFSRYVSTEIEKNTTSNLAPGGRTNNSLLTLGTQVTGKEGAEVARGTAIQSRSEIVYAQAERSVERKLNKSSSTFSRLAAQFKQRIRVRNKKRELSIDGSDASSPSFISRAAQTPTKKSKLTSTKSLFFKKTRDKKNALSLALSGSKDINDFELDTMIGKGMLGFVFSATHRESGQKCAIKVMPKKNIIAVSEESHVMEEKNCLLSLKDSPFIMQLYSAFQDAKALYLSIELCQGDMFELFNAIGLPSIGQTKVYASQVLLGLESIHEKGYIYRDIKPENLLIRSNGSIAICDFGFAKKLGDNERAFTICGTPDYLSPEVLLHQGGSYASDIWAFGVLIFEMMAGYPPFRADTRKKMYDLIVTADFDAVAKPSNFDPKAELLLREIFVQDEEERLGGTDVGEIMDHPWFENLDWIAVQNGTLRPLHMFQEGHVTSISDVLNRNENDGESDFSLGGKADKFWLAEDGGNCSDSRQSGSARSSFSGFADF